MKIELGTTLKQLRRDRDMTQEELANLLGVTYQSVSRWENGACYPDLELIPTIADFFGVTTDQLLGVNDALEQQQVDEYLQRFQESISRGEIDDCIAIARQGVAEHPTNYALLNKLMYALFLSADEDGNIADWRENMQKYDEEITALGKRIITYCPDPDIRMEATARLALHHQEAGRTAEARQVYASLPSQWFCRENQMWWCLTEEEKLPFTREHIRISYNSLGGALYNMVYARLLPDEQLITVFEKSWALKDLILDGDISGTQFYGAQSRCLCAATYARLGKEAEMLEQLQIAADLAKDWDTRPDSGIFHSLLLGDIPWNRTDFDIADTRPCREIMRDKWLAARDFDPLRNTPEFQAILSSLS